MLNVVTALDQSKLSIRKLSQEMFVAVGPFLCLEKDIVDRANGLLAGVDHSLDAERHQRGTFGALGDGSKEISNDDRREEIARADKVGVDLGVFEDKTSCLGLVLWSEASHQLAHTFFPKEETRHNDRLDPLIMDQIAGLCGLLEARDLPLGEGPV